jgi:hypothetical protein
MHVSHPTCTHPLRCRKASGGNQQKALFCYYQLDFSLWRFFAFAIAFPLDRSVGVGLFFVGQVSSR